VKGKSALAISRDLGLSYKSAFVLLHNLREGRAEEMQGRVVGSEGKVAGVDGGYTALAPIGLRSISAVRAAPNSAFTITCGAYPLRYAQESSWREENRRVSNGDQVNRTSIWH
jgi:hypothetical protein